MSINSNSYVKRVVTPLIADELKTGKIVVLIGPRQSGKTTLIKEFLSKSFLIGGPISFDDFKIRQIVENPDLGLKEVISRNIGINLDSPNLIIALDECQKCPAVFEQVKLLYDQHKIRFILTGSSALELYSKSSESLAGRRRLFYLNPFNFREFLEANRVKADEKNSYIEHLKNQSLTEEIGKEIFYKIYKEKEIRLKLLDDILIYGSFPECSMKKEKKDKVIFLKNYRNTYIEKDIIDLSLIDDWRPYNRLLELIAEYNSKTFEIKDLAKIVGVSDKTIKKYLTILQKTFMIKFLPVYTKSTKRRLVKSSKLYFYDMGIVSQLTESFDLPTMISTGGIGHRLEGFVLSEFSKACENFWKPNSLSFWGTNSGFEIDLIYSLENSLTPIEIKYKTNESIKLGSIKAFCEEQKKVKYSCILYRGDYKFDKINNIHYVPVWGL